MISVITPVYNGRRFIELCIRVVIDQVCPDVEHIIMDGGSTDGTIDVIKQYAKEYPHIRWVSERDKGQSDAMNKGISMAKGEILTFLNVDDFYEPNVLNRVIGIFKTLPEPSLLVGNCNVWGDDGELKNVNKPSKLTLRDMLLGWGASPSPANPSAYFYHKSLHQKIGLYKVDEHYVMDLDFLLRAVQRANVKYLDETFGNFRHIQGTKTVNDVASGLSRVRRQRIVMAYRKDLPLFQRLQVAISCKLHISSFLYYWRRLKYYLQNSQELPSMLNRNFTRHHRKR